MISLSFLDQEELSFALAYLLGALPCKAKGVALVTADGEMLGQYLSRHDAPQVEALAAVTRHATCYFAERMGNGGFCYHLNVGADGATLLLRLDAHYYVAITAREVRSIDAFVTGAREGLPPLLDLLGIR